MDAGDNNSYDDINVTPMVDLYLVLLLIFIIMTTAGVQGVKVDLPKGSKAPAVGGPKGKSITVNNEVRGDRATQYQLVMDVLDVLGRLDVKQIGLATVGPK